MTRPETKIIQFLRQYHFRRCGVISSKEKKGTMHWIQNSIVYVQRLSLFISFLQNVFSNVCVYYSSNVLNTIVWFVWIKYLLHRISWFVWIKYLLNRISWFVWIKYLLNRISWFVSSNAFILSYMRKLNKKVGQNPLRTESPPL